MLRKALLLVTAASLLGVPVSAQVPGTYTFYGAGCRGTGQGGGGPVCLSANDDMTLSQATGVAGNFALLANSGANNLAVTGFESWCFTVSGSPVQMTCWLYDRAAGGQPGNILATGTMTVAGAAAWNPVTFSAPVPVPANTDIFCAFDNRVGLKLPIASPGTNLVTHYWNGPPNWSGPSNTQRWNYRVNCTSGGGVVPLLTNGGVPVIAQTFDVKLSFARANAPFFLFIGSSRTAWGGIPLPLDLVGIGAPGCFLNTSGAFLSPAIADGSGAATRTLQIPNDAALIQGRFFNQFLILDGPANAAGLVTTRGGEGTIGG